MPGPPSGRSPTVSGRTPPPKPVIRPWIIVPDLPEVTPVVLPTNVAEAWRGLWHALGSNLPYYVNHSRASRRALRSFGRTHG